MILGLSVLAAALIGWLPVPGFWWRMALGSAILLPLSFLVAGRELLPMLRPSRRHVAIGVLAGAFQYAAGAGVWWVLSSHPRLASDLTTANAWRAAVAVHVGLVLLALIVTAEEVLWRGVVTLPLAGRRPRPGREPVAREVSDLGRPPEQPPRGVEERGRVRGPGQVVWRDVRGGPRGEEPALRVERPEQVGELVAVVGPRALGSAAGGDGLVGDGHEGRREASDGEHTSP